eukprot:COSAG01_NODE_1359_length_10584_cov_133.767668_2_plen_180_part_00
MLPKHQSSQLIRSIPCAQPQQAHVSSSCTRSSTGQGLCGCGLSGSAAAADPSRAFFLGVGSACPARRTQQQQPPIGRWRGACPRQSQEVVTLVRAVRVHVDPVLAKVLHLALPNTGAPEACVSVGAGRACQSGRGVCVSWGGACLSVGAGRPFLLTFCDSPSPRTSSPRRPRLYTTTAR